MAISSKSWLQTIARGPGQGLGQGLGGCTLLLRRLQHEIVDGQPRQGAEVCQQQRAPEAEAQQDVQDPHPGVAKDACVFPQEDC